MSDGICSLLRWFIYIFQICGYCPISTSNKTRFERSKDTVTLAWSILLVASVNCTAVATLIYNEVLFNFENTFARFNDYFKLSLNVLTFNLSAWQSIKMRHYERNFWELYIELRSSRSSSVQDNLFVNQLREHKRFVLKFLGTCIASIFVPIMFGLLYVGPDNYLKFFWFQFAPYVCATIFRNMQFIFYLDLIRVEVKSLDSDLAVLVEFTTWERPNRSFVLFEEFTRRRIVEKQRDYQKIYEMVQSFQLACNWSIVFHMFYSYVRFLVNSYFCIWSFMNHWNPMEDILLIPAILEIPMFLLTAKSCMTAAKYISYRVHNLKHSAENVAASIQIQNFSLQLLHQKIKIDGLGIASMDGYMLTKAVGSITTYMVFFIQFMPKFKSKFD